MRILHTSDWHLGLQTSTVSRLPDQESFLNWLLDLIADQQVDALLVAGDIFDGMQPSAEALAAYYRFLARLPATGVRDVVLVGGNHDSPSRLDAPQAVLAALDIRVVGGLPPAEEMPDELVVPLRPRGSETPGAVCLAVPYVHEYRLGVRTTDPDPNQVRRAFQQRFEELYRDLTDRAIERYPDLPVVATGHLAMGCIHRQDFRDPIHQVGFIGTLPPSVLDRRIAYGALGHIHRAFPVEPGRIWYSGSPIQVSFTDGIGDRRVLLVDLPADGGPGTITPVPVPVFRELRLLEGTPDALEEALATMTSDAPLPPLVHVRARLDEATPGLRERLHRAVERNPRPQRPLVTDILEVFTAAQPEFQEAPAVALEEQSEEEVFALLCQYRGEPHPEDLQQAFRTVALLPPEDLARWISEIRNGENEVP